MKGQTMNSYAHYFDVTSTLVGRELRIRYKGSALGILWAVLSPLGMVLILHILFSRILPLGIPNFAAFIYSGLLAWTWFQSAVFTAAATLNDNRDLVRKPFFPSQLLPGVVTATNFILYLLALPVMFFLLVIQDLAITPAVLLLPLVWLALGLFTLACAILVAALGALIRDIQHLLGVGMLLWFYLTPIFYDPERISPEIARWIMLNPMAVLVQAHRQILLYGQTPDLVSLAAAGLVSLVLLAGSLALFRFLQDVFVEEV
jgi:lipopolysaccharide transport system permease protein